MRKVVLMFVLILAVGQLKANPVDQQGASTVNTRSNRPCMVVDATTEDILYSEKCWFQSEKCEEQPPVTGKCVGHRSQVKLYYCKEKPNEALETACEVCDDISGGAVHWTERQLARSYTCDLDHHIIVSKEDSDERVAVAFYRDNCKGESDTIHRNSHMEFNPRSCSEALAEPAQEGGSNHWDYPFLWQWVWDLDQEDDTEKEERVEGGGSNVTVEIDLLREEKGKKKKHIESHSACKGKMDPKWCGHEEFNEKLMCYDDYYFLEHCCNLCASVGVMPRK